MNATQFATPGPRALAVMHRERKCRGSERVSADGFGSANLGRGTGFVDRNKAEGGREPGADRQNGKRRAAGRADRRVRPGGVGMHAAKLLLFFLKKSLRLYEHEWMCDVPWPLGAAKGCCRLGCHRHLKPEAGASLLLSLSPF